MKTAALILTALLAACGEGATVVASDTAVREPVQVVEAPRMPVVAPVRIEPPVDTPSRAVEPEPIVQVGCDPATRNPCDTSTPPAQVTCDLWSYNPCGSFPPPGPGYELCDLTSYNPCARPTWVYKQPVNPEPVIASRL